MTTRERQRKPEPEVGGKFRVLAGSHIGAGPAGCDCMDCARSSGKNHVYDSGDIIETPHDLERRFNQGPRSRKFERVVEGQPGTVVIGEAELAELRRQASLVTPASLATSAAPAKVTTPIPLPDFAKMNDKDLRAYAEDNEIDVSKCRTRDEVIKAVKG